MHTYQVPHAEHMEKSKWRSSKRWQGDAMLSSAYLHESANEVNRSGGDEQVISCHCYLVFHLYVEQLTVFQTPGLILASSSIFRVLNLDHHAIAQW